MLVNNIRMGTDTNIGASSRLLLADRVRTGVVQTANGSIALAVVADGMGGLYGGERAAELIIQTVFRYLESTRPVDVQAFLRNAVEAANRVVYHEAQGDRNHNGMAASVALAAIQGDHLYVASVGNSRVYLVHARQAQQLTRDHTWGAEVVQAGRLSLQEAERSPRRDDITRLVGRQPEVCVDAGAYQEPVGRLRREQAPAQGIQLAPGDRVVLCTDGLTRTMPAGGHILVGDELGRKALRGSPQAAARALVETALARQVRDNVSVAIMEIPKNRSSMHLPIKINWPSLPITRPAMLMLGGVVALGVLAGIIAIFSRGVDDTSIPLSDPKIGHAYFLEGSDTLLFRTPDGWWNGLNEQSLEFNDRPSVRNDDPSGFARIIFPGGVELFMAPATEIECTESVHERTVITLMAGALLVRTPEAYPVAGYFLVFTPNGGHAEVRGSLMGVMYDPSARQFYVDCLKGFCAVGTDGMERGLNAGAHATLTDELEPGAGNRNELWQFAPGLVLAPTPTRTATATSVNTFTLIPPTPNTIYFYSYTVTPIPFNPIDTVPPQPSLQAPQVSLSFGGMTLTIVVSNPNAVPLNGVSFQADYPSGLKNAGSPSTDCEGGVAGGLGDAYVSLGGATLVVGSSCSVQVTVTGPSGTYTVSTQAQASGGIGPGDWGSATLVIP